MNKNLIDENFRGIVYILQNDEVLCERVTGYADLPNEISNTLDTRFGSASAGKVFVAVAILLVVLTSSIVSSDRTGKITV